MAEDEIDTLLQRLAARPQLHRPLHLVGTNASTATRTCRR